ncbi:MAG: hypothetical protein A3J24_08685 [Deltaproteobacteria bacterium RIFCSPLOWO2_02_FULL_53_8]|nr:MAG: hypothetical protein A3J24_08685 [Deltaproteobacteria bacterium RIFCSPLOWO2_02_FULL_53_8]
MRRESSEKPTYDLDELKTLIENIDSRYITDHSINDAMEIGYSKEEIIITVMSLKHNEFYKTMPAKKIQGLWQDVYKPTRTGIKLYIKLQKSYDGKCVVISFEKE